MCTHMNATITKGVTLAAHEITSYHQQIARICKLKFKITSAAVKSLLTLCLTSKSKRRITAAFC